MTPSSLPKNAFPLPTPLEPTLAALGLDKKTARALSTVYISSAHTLKARCEAEYAHACAALLLASDERGYCSKELRSKLLAVAVTRYSQALAKWEKEAKEKAKASLRQRPKRTMPGPKVKSVRTLSSKPSLGETPRPHSKEETSNAITGLEPFGASGPPHAFPQPYPPPVGPEPLSFVTHIPLLEKSPRPEPSATSDDGLEMCITAFSRLSLGPPSRGRKPSNAVALARSTTSTTSNPKLISKLCPSRSRLVLPTLDTSVAVPHKPRPKNTSSRSSSIDLPRTPNIDIPRSNRRKVCSIPYRRPSVRPSASPESPTSSFCGIRRTPSLVSDHGSETSSPSTPPDFPPIPAPSPTVASKDLSPEAVSSLEELFVPHSESWWQGSDFGTDFYG